MLQLSVLSLLFQNESDDAVIMDGLPVVSDFAGLQITWFTANRTDESSGFSHG
jgi:hypothetical protein